MKIALTAAGISFLFVLVLHSMGRLWICECGFGLLEVSAMSSSTSQHLADPYSLSHVLHGILFFWLLLPLAKRFSLQWRAIAALFIEIAWEILENTPLIINRYRTETAALNYTGDSILNSVGDVAFCMLGFWLAFRLKWKWTLLLLLLIEVLMLLTIKDNLTLNIVMLLFPLESIKEWQMR